MEENYMEQAKSLINDYLLEEFGDCSIDDFRDLSNIGIGYTTITDEEIPIQAIANLVDFRIERYLGDKLYDTRQYSSIGELIDAELNDLDFDELTYVEDEKAVAFVKNMEG